MKERRKGRKGAGEEGEGLKKGPWTAAEDAVLTEYVREHGEGNWNAVQRNSGLFRCGKSCRLRWANHLRPNLKKGAFSPEEELLILRLHSQLGNKWARMAAHLPGRTDNEIKNYWNTRIKRRQRHGLPLYPPEIQCHAAANPSPPPLPSPTPDLNSQFPFSYLNPIGLPPVQTSAPLVPRFPLASQVPQCVFQQSFSKPLYQPPMRYDLGNYDIGSACSGASEPITLSVKMELPSNQLFPEAGVVDGSGEPLGTASSGLLDALLEEAQSLRYRQHCDLLAATPANEHEPDLGRIGVGSSSNNSGNVSSSSPIIGPFENEWNQTNVETAAVGGIEMKREPADEISQVQEDISTLLDMIPTTQLPLTPLVLEWYNDDSAEISNGQLSAVTEDEIGLEMQQLASSISGDPPDPARSIGSCAWNNMPGIC